MQPFLKERYIRNKNTITDEDQHVLASKRVLVIGLGALGGFVFEQFTRIGICYLTGYDFDVFEASNLNRQRFCSESTLGQSKAKIVEQQCKEINSSLTIHCMFEPFDASNQKLLQQVDLVIEASDSIKNKIDTVLACKEAKKPCIVGAIGGHLGQVMVYQNQYDSISELFPNYDHGIEQVLGNPVYTPALIASLMSKLSLDVLLHKNKEDKHYVVDLDDVEIIQINKRQSTR